MIININTRYQSQNLDKLSSDLKLLKDKVLLYYTENGKYPIKSEPLQNGNGQEYEIELSKLSGLTLNFGSGKNGAEDIYIIDISNGVISYKRGIEYKNKIIHSFIADNEIDQIETIPVLKITNQIMEIQDESGNIEKTVEVTENTKSLTLKTGTKVVFKVGTNLTDGISYQWYKNGEKIVNATNGSYEIAEIENGVNYYCEITYDTVTKKTEKVTLFLEN